MPRARPKWMSTVPSGVRHPGSTLREAAAVIRVDATLTRSLGKQFFPMARTMDRVADALVSVSNGATWEQAFGLPSQKTIDRAQNEQGNGTGKA